MLKVDICCRYTLIVVNCCAESIYLFGCILHQLCTPSMVKYYAGTQQLINRQRPGAGETTKRKGAPVSLSVLLSRACHELQSHDSHSFYLLSSLSL